MRSTRSVRARALRADHAGANSNKYIFATVFFAAVLCCAGISIRFRWLPMGVAVLILAASVLLYGAARLTSLPRL